MSRVTKNMKSFAQTCMMQLVHTKKFEDSIPEISSYDIYRIHEILRKYKVKDED